MKYMTPLCPLPVLVVVVREFVKKKLSINIKQKLPAVRLGQLSPPLLADQKDLAIIEKNYPHVISVECPLYERLRE